VSSPKGQEHFEKHPMDEMKQATLSEGGRK
jgi:hypothetical protein